MKITNQKAKEYLDRAVKSIGQTIVFLLLVLVIEWLLDPPLYLFIILLCGLIIVIDAYYSMKKKTQAASGKRVVKSCLGMIAYILGLNYLYFFFGYWGLLGTIIGYLLISTMIGVFMIWRNWAEYKAAVSLLSDMVRTWIGK